MSTTDVDTSEQQRAALANRLLADLIASMETLGVWLGLRLGLYAVLARNGPRTAPELASDAGIDARYAREWLEQQAVAGVLATADEARDAEHRRYTLPAAHRDVLLDEVSPYFLAPVSYALAGVAGVLPELLAAYRSGAGVPFAAYGEEMFVLLSPVGNAACTDAAQRYRGCLTDPRTFDARRLEEIVQALRITTSDPWVDELHDRYFGRLPEQLLR